MRRHTRFIALLFSVICTLMLSIESHATTTDPLTTIEFETPVHFLAPDGSPLVTESTTFTVEAAEEWLRLIPGERRDAVLIEAKKGTHELDISDALALSVSGTEEDHKDLHHVILLLPNGESLESTGTYSGIRPRGVFGNAITNVKEQANRAYKKARSTAKKTVSKAKSTARKATKQVKKQTQKSVSKAKKGVQNVQRQARKTTKQVVTKAQKGVQSARNAALHAKRQVEKTGRRVAGAVKSGIQGGVQQLQNNPLVAKLQSEIQTLNAVRQLRLEPLFRCLKGAKGSRIDISRYAQELLRDPGRFTNARMNEVWTVVENNFDHVMGEHLQALQGGTRPLTIQQILDRSERTMQRIAERHPGMKCLHQFVKPHMSKIKSAAAAYHRNLQARSKKIIDTKIAPIVYRTITGNLQNVFAKAIQAGITPSNKNRRIRKRGISEGEIPPIPDEEQKEVGSTEASGQIATRGISKDELKGLLPGGKEIKTIAQGVAAKHLLSPAKIQDIAQKVQRLASALGNESAARSALEEVQQAISRNSPLPEIVLFDIGVEILRFMGHKYLDSELPGNGRFWVNMGISTLNFTEDTVGNIVEGLCGLIPEAGAAACAVVKELIEAGYHYAGTPPAEAAMVKGLHKAFNLAMDKGKEAIKNRHDPRRFRDQAGPLGFLLDRFPTKKALVALAKSEVKETEMALFAYHTSVGQLAQAAAR